MSQVDTYQLYIEGVMRQKPPLIGQIEQYAKENHVPIMDSNTIEAFLGLLQLQNPRNILEIGSAIGYSAIRIAQSLPKTTIMTIERDSKRYMKALEFIGAAGLQNRIQIVEADALQPAADIVLDRTYDALFIDAAKGQYRRFFEKYSSVVAPGGIIYCDNMFMRGMVLQEIEDIPRRKRTMIRNLKEFTIWIMAHPDYDATLLPMGDGVLIAKKK